MRRPPSPEMRHQAEAWARQAHGQIQRVQEMPSPRQGWFSSGNDQSTEVCDQVLGVVLFNLGMLREVSVFPPRVQQNGQVEFPIMVDGPGPRNRTVVVRAEPKAMRKGRDEGRRPADKASVEKSWSCCRALGVVHGAATLQVKRDRSDCAFCETPTTFTTLYTGNHLYGSPI